MTAEAPRPKAPVWPRPLLTRYQPDRARGNFYRTAESKGRALGGVPLSSTQDAVVAAVRLAYDVAEAQIDRSSRLAERLRTAGDRAIGNDSERKAVDAAEQLVFKAMLGGLTWLESLAAEGDSPLKRLAAAQYRLLGGMLGLGEAPMREGGTPPGEGTFDSIDPMTPPIGAGAPKGPGAAARLQIVHTADVAERRAVQIRRYEIASPKVLPTPIKFYGMQTGQPRLDGTFSIDETGPKLIITVGASIPGGVWRAAICDDQGVQLGWMEIEV